MFIYIYCIYVYTYISMHSILYPALTFPILYALFFQHFPEGTPFPEPSSPWNGSKLPCVRPEYVETNNGLQGHLGVSDNLKIACFKGKRMVALNKTNVKRKGKHRFSSETSVSRLDFVQ